MLEKLKTNYWLKVFFIFLSVAFLVFIIWFRLLRSRLPRDLPFNLTLISFILISILCIIHSIAIINLLNANKLSSNNILKQIFAWCYKPLEYLDKEIKEHAKIKPYFEKYFLRLRPLVSKYYYIITYMELLPRLILVITFTLDTFIFHKIFYTYKVIPILIILFCAKYILHTFNKVKEEQMYKCNEKVEIHLDNFMGPIISIDKFIETQMHQIINKKPLINYDLYTRSEYKKILIKKLDITRNNNYVPNFKAIYATQKNILNLILNISSILYNDILYKVKFKSVYYIISMLYLICWSYILFISFSTLTLTSNELNFIKNLQDIYDPFLGLPINEQEIEEIQELLNNYKHEDNHN